MNCDKCTYQHNWPQSRCQTFPSPQKVLSCACAVTPTTRPIAWLALGNYRSALCHHRLPMSDVEFHISRIIQSVIFDICFLLLCISLLLSFSNLSIFLHVSVIFFLFHGTDIPQFAYSFIHLLADQHLGHFQLGTIINKSFVNIHSCVYMCSFLMDKCLRVE